MVQERKHMRNLLGILKDKTSLIKIALSIKRPVHGAVIRATAHSSKASPPSNHRVNNILSLGHHSRPTASSCVTAIMDRLHKTSDAHVALKCLFMLHQIILRGSFVIKEQLSFYPSAGGRNSLNLLMFRDGHARELSEWVRWYASVLEHNLMASRVLGTYFSSSTTNSNNDNPNRIKSAPESNSDVMREIDALVSMVKQISRAPESLECQRDDLVYEIVNSVGDDYRSAQQQLRVRLCEFSEKIDELSSEETTELVNCFETLEECKESLKMLFVNRKRNEAFWHLVRNMKMRAAKLAEEKIRWLVVRKEDDRKLAWREGRLATTSQVLMLTNNESQKLNRIHYSHPLPSPRSTIQIY